MLTRLAFALFGGLAMTAAADPAVAQDASGGRDSWRWKYRPVIVFAPEAGNPRLQRQKQIVAAASGAMRERDIVVVYVVGGNVSRAFGPGPSGGADALRKRYGVGRGDFAALLVGKDGGVKLRSATPLSAQRLSGVIDAMPMRQDEMRRSR